MATVVISSELMEALENRLKAQAETITRLTAELERITSAIEDIKIYGNNPSAWEYYDDGVSQKISALVKAAKSEQVKDVCTCGHSLDSHTKSGVHPCEECECLMFWAEVTKC